MWWGLLPPLSAWGLPWWLSWWIIHLQCRRPQFNSWVRKICWRRDRLPTPVLLGFPGGSADKESACNAETWVWSLGWEDPLEKGKATHSIFRPGEFHGLYNTWGCKELDMTEWLSFCMHETKQDAEKLSNMNKVMLANVEAQIQSQVLYLYLHLPKPLCFTAFPSTCKYPEMGC